MVPCPRRSPHSVSVPPSEAALSRLAKNTAQRHTLFALANLVIVTKALLAQVRA